ncbi:NAD-dependent epimerase/dehydratase family protein [Vibrio artabrorum]|uniref:NAD-dependent epimerase/dehydratase family protein n=1 Tax=Vibrio artabrorum TaxID=446374 RepID=UPI0035524D61
MRILITGIAGFVGSSIARNLLQKHEYIDIVGVDDMSYGYQERLEGLEERIEFLKMDIKNLASSSINNIDVIIHCAAIAPLPENQKNIFKSCEQNIAMCGAVSDFATDIGCENIIFFSSGAVYEGSGNRASSEKDKVEPSLIYPTTKFLAEKVFESVAKTYGLKVVSIRLFNLYGPRQDYFRKQPPLLGYLLKNAIQRESITLYASQKSKRDYIYIDDLCDLIECIRMKFENIENGEFIPVNAASNSAYSVYDIIIKLEKVSGLSIPYERGDKKKFWDNYPELKNKRLPFNDIYLEREVDKTALADISFAREFFNWEPQTSLENGLSKCYEYAKEVLN